MTHEQNNQLLKFNDNRSSHSARMQLVQLAQDIRTLVHMLPTGNDEGSASICHGIHVKLDQMIKLYDEKEPDGTATNHNAAACNQISHEKYWPVTANAAENNTQPHCSSSQLDNLPPPPPYSSIAPPVVYHAPHSPQTGYSIRSSSSHRNSTACAVVPNSSSAKKPQIDEPILRPTISFRAQTDAELLYKAMKGLGTDEISLVRILCFRTCAERCAIAAAFKQMYGKPLIKKLQSETSGNFEKLLVALCLAPDVYDALSVRKAIEGFGTDEDSLIEILCSRSNKEINAMKAAYRQEYGCNMETDIKNDTSGWFARLLISLSTAVRDDSKTADVERARRTAQELYNRGEKRWGTDEAYFNSVLAAQSYAQLRCVFDEYHRVSGNSFEHAIKSEMSGDVMNGMLAIIKCVRNPSSFFAEQLYKSMKGVGTRDHVLIRVLITRSEKDLGNIKRIFQRKYNKSLEDFIRDDTSGDYKRSLLALCGVLS